MNAAALCVAMMAVGLDWGVNPLPDGGFEYLVHIKPSEIALLGPGEALRSSIPSEARGGIREVRVVVADSSIDVTAAPDEVEPTEPAVVVPDPPESEPDSAKEAPRTLPNSPDVIRATAELPEPSPGDGNEPDAVEPDKEPLEAKDDSPDWMPLMLLTVVAAGSSSGMFYFGWLALDYRSRYLHLLREGMASGNAWLDEPPALSDRDGDRRFDIDAPAADRLAADSQGPQATVSEEAAWKELGSDDETLKDWLDGSENGKRSNRDRGK